ncbi:MAG: hypothetical protein HZA79_15045 [Sphingobacteriales bacterium]|nr:hypothetical protein [Sphingobacteriales bacterium]
MSRLLILLFIFFSCNTIARKGYGAKKQKTESPETIKAWLTKQGFHSDQVFSIAPEYYLEYTIGSQSAPLLFDVKSGKFLAIGFTNGKYCPKEIDKSFANVLPYQLLKVKPDSFLVSESVQVPAGYTLKDKDKFRHRYDTTVYTLENMRHLIRTLNGEPVTEISGREADYILLLPFALYLGNRIQVKDLKKYYYSALSNRFSKISIAFINSDKQQWWGEKWNHSNTMKYY